MGQFSLVDHSGNQPIIYNIVPTRKLIASPSIECGMCVKDTLSSQNKAITPVISTNPSLNEQAGWARRHIQFFGGPKRQHCSGISHCDREDKPPVKITSSCSKFLNFSLGDATPEASAGWRTEVPIAALPAERGPSALLGCCPNISFALRLLSELRVHVKFYNDVPHLLQRPFRLN